MTHPTYFTPGLTAAQRDALDRVGCGDYDLAGVDFRTIKRLLELELIRPIGAYVICQDSFGTVSATRYEMPQPVHFAWTMWQSAGKRSGPGVGHLCPYKHSTSGQAA